MRKKYHDARHNCFAYRIYKDGIERSSDDGEPSGTAGAPMLAILNGNNLSNCLAVVTRYFGGILLGTGGLVRAYSDATINSIEQAVKVERCLGIEAAVTLEYNNLENFKYYCKINNIEISNSEYSDIISCRIELEEENKERLINDFNTKNINLIDLKLLSKKLINKCIIK